LDKLSSHERDEGHDAGFFDGVGQNPLMAGASAVAFGRVDFALRVHKTAQKIGIFEIYLVHLILAEIANLFFLGSFHNCKTFNF